MPKFEEPSLWDFAAPETEAVAEAEEELAEFVAEVGELLPALPESAYPPGAEELPSAEPVEGQTTLFGSDDEFTIAGQEWKGMPEFAQQDLTAWKSIIVNLEDRAALDAFAKAVDQNLTTRTRSIWYPEAEIGHFIDKRYRDASADPRGEETP